MALSTSEVTQFKGTLLPRHQADAGRRHGTAVPPNRNTVGGLILHALDPLRSDLDALLAHDNRSAALRLAYNALAQVADALAAYRGDTLRPGQIHIHALMVELETLPLEPQPDGTLAERGTAVKVSYRNWAVTRSQASFYAQALTERLLTLWPGTWIVMPPATGPAESQEGRGAQ